MRFRTTAVAALLLPAVAGLSGAALAAERSLAATCAPQGTALSITAENNRFDKDCLAAPAGQAVTITFDNKDRALPHNVSIYDEANGDKALFTGEVTYGPKTTTYDVPALPAGTYQFRCDPHPDFMFGSFVVGQQAAD